MLRLAMAICLTVLTCAPRTTFSQARFPSQAPAAGATNSIITIPGGTKVELAITSPIWARSAAPGTNVYAEVIFPVALSGRMAIPAGTQAQGVIDSLKRPGLFSPHAEIQVHFTNLVFANGYAISLYGPEAATALVPVPLANDVIPAVSSVYVDATIANDLLLDNSAQIEMVMQEPISLDASQVASAIQRSRPVDFSGFQSSTLCRPVPGTTGTPDTVIPGTPGTPGTPDTVIPGVNGAPDTVIPGIPATPGTHDTVIPGTPGTPGITCPDPPIVETNPKPQKYSEKFDLTVPVQIAGTLVQPGSYVASWTGTGPEAQVEILQKKKVLASATVHVFLLIGKSQATTPQTSSPSGGTSTLQSLRFKGLALALYFDLGAG
jgi:hypothetical protein